jgi:hypothetical protein
VEGKQEDQLAVAIRLVQEGAQLCLEQSDRIHEMRANGLDTSSAEEKLAQLERELSERRRRRDLMLAGQGSDAEAGRE